MTDPQFSPVAGVLVPVLPVTLDGKPRPSDGVHYMTLEQASKNHGIPAADLRRAYDFFLRNQSVPDANPAARLGRLREMVYPTATDEEFGFLLDVYKELDLSPWFGLLWISSIHNERTGRNEMVPVAKIDGLRTLAARSGIYRGQTAPRYMDDAGEWLAGWAVTGAPPVAVKIGVRVAGHEKPTWGIARYDEYALDANGNEDPLYKLKPCMMLETAAESRAIRKAFGKFMPRIYTADELRGSGPSRPRKGKPPQWGEADLSPQGCRLKMADLGLGYEAREQAMRDFAARFPLLLANNESAFYAKVLEEVSRDPARSGEIKTA